MKGKLLIISAPSGAGKTTLVRALLAAGLGLEFSVSACSRPKRNKEVDGRDYYFLGIDGFRQKIAEGAFLEWEEVYKDHFYGTLKPEVERIRQAGRHVIFDVDVYGGLNIKRQYPDESLAIFVMPPSVEVLEERLRNRMTDSEENIARRIGKARQEMELASDFDRIIVNDEIGRATAEAIRVVSEFLNQHA
jgi:guanylate kinase